MILYKTSSILLCLPFIFGHPDASTLASQNKTKRAVSSENFNSADRKPILLYVETPQNAVTPELQTSASTSLLKNFYPTQAVKPLALVNVQQPIQVFQDDNPKQVAEQQVLYEFQQTPTNAVSNVHVKQLFQPSVEVTSPSPYHRHSNEQHSAIQPLSTIQPASTIVHNHQLYRPQPHAIGLVHRHPSSSSTIVSPVQHSFFTNHAQNYQNPFSTHETHQAKQNPGKYIYLNGQIVYNPVHIIPEYKITPNSIYHKGVYHNQQKLPLIQKIAPQPVQQQPAIPRPSSPGFWNHNNDFNSFRPQVRTNLPGFLPPISKGFQPPKHLQQIDQPSSAPKKNDDDEEEEEAEEEEEEKEADGEEEGDEEEEEQADDEEDASSQKNDKRKQEKEDDEEAEDDKEEEEEETSDDNPGYEVFPFAEDDYLDGTENHFFRPVKFANFKEKKHKKNFENDDDDEDDADRDASKHHKRYQHYYKGNNPKKYINDPKFAASDNKYAFYEGYSSDMKYKSPSRHGNKFIKRNKPLGKFKKVKYSKLNGRRPRVEKIEGKFSENVPITHKQKVFKQRWFVTKDVNGTPIKKIKIIT